MSRSGCREGLRPCSKYTSGKIIGDSLQTPVNFGPIEQANVTAYQNGRTMSRLERSSILTDVSKPWVVSVLYELPFGKWIGILNKASGGWQFNTIGVMQSGIPSDDPRR